MGEEEISKNNSSYDFYPINSIYLSVNSTNPSVYFGGTWTQIAQGRVLIGVGTGKDVNGYSKTIQAEETGGSYNLQKHCHSYTRKVQSSVSLFGTSSSSYQIYVNQGTGYVDYYGAIGVTNNIQPYYGVYIWKRIE